MVTDAVLGFVAEWKMVRDGVLRLLVEKNKVADHGLGFFRRAENGGSLFSMKLCRYAIRRGRIDD
jgi:hypothetical protein